MSKDQASRLAAIHQCKTQRRFCAVPDADWELWSSRLRQRTYVTARIEGRRLKKMRLVSCVPQCGHIVPPCFAEKIWPKDKTRRHVRRIRSIARGERILLFNREHTTSHEGKCQGGRQCPIVTGSADPHAQHVQIAMIEIAKEF